MRCVPLHLLAPAALLLGLTACTVNPATGGTSFTGFMSESDEARIGQENHPKILEEFGGAYPDPKVQAYVQNVGKSVSSHSERPDVQYRFTVLNSDIVNAFAMPGGYVYVTRGLLAEASTEAELAGVLGHETGHVAARHMAQRYSQSVLAQLAAAGLGIATGNQEIATLATQGAAVYLQSFSRDEEFQADLLGVRYMSRAGYDPHGMATFLDKLLMHSQLDATLSGHPGQADQFDIMATHPRTADRVARATEEAGITPVAHPVVGGDAYLAKIDGILYGDDPKDGVIRGQTFLHPGLRLAFEAPPGFRLINGSKQVTADGPTDDSGLAFDRAPKATGSDMVDYLSRDWAANLDLQDVSRISIGDLPAATGAGLVDTDSGRLWVRVAAVRLDSATYRFLFIAPPAKAQQLDPGFQQTIQSFRRLSPAEAAAIKPQHIKIVTVSAGDSIASLSQRMPFADYREERFRALNGLRPGNKLVPGQRVKIVVD